MSEIVTHNKDEKKKSKKKSTVTLLVTVVVILLVLFGLNYMLSSKNKNNSSLVTSPVDSSYTMGSQNAKVKLVEYADFQCPACKAFHEVFPTVYKDINDEYGTGTLSLTYKYFPLVQIHKNALLAARSAEAARLQGKFWEMGDVLFKNQDTWGEALDAQSLIEGYAKDLGLDMAQFIKDRDSEQTVDTVNNALAEATRLRLDHTPTIFMDGTEMTDLTLDPKDIESRIETELTSKGVKPLANQTTN